jgi:hypothetical protein
VYLVHCRPVCPLRRHSALSVVQIYEKEVANIVGYNHDAHAMAHAPATGNARPVSVPNAESLRIPQVVDVSRTFDAKCRRSYCSNTHFYYIHSVSVCSDQSTFMTADDLSVYLWDLERPDSSMQVLNIRPDIPDETEVCFCCSVDCQIPLKTLLLWLLLGRPWPFHQLVSLHTCQADVLSYLPF